MRLLLSILLCLPLAATTRTVCASGCDYTSFQSALTATASDCAIDVLQLTAGETFEGEFNVPFRACAGRVVVRTSAYASLPAPGNRVTSAHASLMPKIQPNNGNGPALKAGYDEVYVSSVNPATDTITFGSSHGWSNGDPVACWYYQGTAPVAQNQVYYIRDAAPTTAKFAATPGGAAIDLTATHTATFFRCTIARSVRGWTFQGIEIRAKVGQESQYNLVQIGSGQATARAGFTTDFVFDRVYIHGHEGEEGPQVCLFLESRAITVADSRIEQCKRGGYESKAISMPEVTGPAVIRNNYIEGAGINLLVGGDYVRVEGMVSGDEGGIVFEGNHFFKPLSYKTSSGTGGASDPVGACSNGARYLNTTSGAWFVCASSTWAAAPTCANGEYFRRTDVTQNCASGACWSCSGGVFVGSNELRPNGYAVKNLFEIKSGINIVVRGNVFENNWIDGQDGLALLIIALGDGNNTAGWARGENIRFERNIVRNSALGVRIAATNSVLNLRRNNRVSMTDNLVYKIGTTDYPSIDAPASRPMSVAGPCDDCTIDHNTIVTAAPTGIGMLFDTAAFTRPRLSNTIFHGSLYGMLRDGGLPIADFWGGDGNIVNTVMVDVQSSLGAPASFGAYATNGKYITPATTLFAGGGDYRLAATSPYSAACGSGCDFAATTGKDLGADIDAVDTATQGAVGGTPWLGGSIRMAIGSIRAIAHYTAPDASACTVKLYTGHAARTAATPHGDTDSGGEQVDSRAGSLSVGTSRQLVLGTNTALTASTAYSLVVTCGASVALAQFRTLPAGSGTSTAYVSLGSAATGEYSSSADMSSPTSIPSSTTHAVPIPAGVVRYYRTTGGSVQALIAR